MAKKDLLRRAGLVLDEIANTVPPTAQAERPENPQPPFLARKSMTSPGSMVNFMRESSEVHKDLKKAQDKLAQFEGAQVARPLDPALVKPSRWANRAEQSFATEAFVQLKAEISSAGGNVQPIKVRNLKDAGEGEPQYELVFGHRRHRACLELGLPVLAILCDDMSDQDLFIEMDRENRARADLSAWEQGVEYKRALDNGLFPSARQLAAVLGVDHSQLSKALRLAKLPPEVVEAFASPLDLQFRWVTELSDTVQADPDGLRERAARIKAAATRPAPAAIFKALVTKDGAAPKRDGYIWRQADTGKEMATLKVGKSRVQLAINRSLNEQEFARLQALVDSFNGGQGAD